MISDTKCECGHQNPPGTPLCESCGKPQDGLGGDAAELEMKYDGVLRRSQREGPVWLDRIWRFFSSVRVAVWLIVLTLTLAALGTVYPQENTIIGMEPKDYYQQAYGMAGQMYNRLGLSHTYESWWFITLLVMIGISLVVCSLDRVLPLYRALSKQQIRKHPDFLLRQKTCCCRPLPPDVEPGAWMAQTAAELKKRRYRVHMDNQGTALLAEKHRFSRCGPYIHHIGLILFLAAVLMRSIPGWHMDRYLAFPEGHPVKIPETPYYLENRKFTVAYYEEHPSIPKLFETQAVLYRCLSDCSDPFAPPVLEEVHWQSITVNKPLRYQELLAYQFDYMATPMLLSIELQLMVRSTGEKYGPLHLSMYNPGRDYQAGPYKLKLTSYFPEFELDQEGHPITISKEPRAPGFVFLIRGPDLKEEGETYMYFPLPSDRERFRQDELNGVVASRIELGADSMNQVQVSAYTSFLNIRKDKAMPFIWSGTAVSMVGLVMGFYWQHRRIWLRLDGETLLLGAHTNKNRFGLRKECAFILGKSGIAVKPQELERGGGRLDANA